MANSQYTIRHPNLELSITQEEPMESHKPQAIQLDTPLHLPDTIREWANSQECLLWENHNFQHQA